MENSTTRIVNLCRNDGEKDKLRFIPFFFQDKHMYVQFWNLSYGSDSFFKINQFSMNGSGWNFVQLNISNIQIAS